METILVDHIPVKVTKEDVLRKLGMPADHRYGSDIEKVIAEAETIANAKLLYAEAKIEARTEDTVTIGGVVFKGRDLADALKDVDTVYPYICTCGRELNDYAMNCKDLVKMLYLDYIAHFYLLQSSVELSDRVDNQLGTRSMCMTPGSFDNWELKENIPIFMLLNKGEGMGIMLNETGIMYPAKSVAGIRFKAPFCEDRCAICLKKDCGNRKADFDKRVYEDTLC